MPRKKCWTICKMISLTFTDIKIKTGIKQQFRSAEITAFLLNSVLSL